MPADAQYSADEVINEIVENMSSLDGESLAELYNLMFGNRSCQYDEDGFFTIKVEK